MSCMRYCQFNVKNAQFSWPHSTLEFENAYLALRHPNFTFESANYLCI